MKQGLFQKMRQSYSQVGRELPDDLSLARGGYDLGASISQHILGQDTLTTTQLLLSLLKEDFGEIGDELFQEFLGD